MNLNKYFKYIFLLIFSITMASCSGLLDSDNPNSLIEEDLDDPRAFALMVNGVEVSVVRAYGNILAPYSVASDEMIWIGSRDAWQQLNFGNLSNVNNEFTDAAFPYLGEARWWSDEVIRRGEEFQSAGALLSGDEGALARAYIYGAIIQIVIADMFDDFVISSSKLEAGMPVGNDGMNKLYDQALDYINKGIALNAGFDVAFQGLLARAQHSKAIWGKLNPVNTSDPLVNAGTAAATAALGLMGSDDSFDLITSASAPGTIGGLDIAGEVNQRQEMRLSNVYIIPNAEDTKPANVEDGDPATTISLNDPIDDIPDPALHKNVVNFTVPNLYPSYPVVSTREMHLILAEGALASGDMDGFTTHINNLRAIDGLTDYSGQMDAQELLIHSRRVNLFLQGRRIADHYRFNSPSTYWVPQGDATNSPGTFFPITITEIRANPNLN